MASRERENYDRELARGIGRYRQAALEALSQLEWCIDYLHGPRRRTSPGRSRVGQGLLTEALITFVLVFVVGLVASDPRVPSARIASIAVGFALAAGVFIGRALTGGGVNPARALGPMIVSGELDDFWIYIVGPLIGAVLAAFVAAYALRAFQMEQDNDDEPTGAVRRSGAPR